MLYKKPKNDHKYTWTNHVVGKMAYYGISESLVKRVVRFPKRMEVGIAPSTTACMQPTGSKKRPAEVWVMWKEVQNAKIKNQNDNLKLKNGGVLNVPKKKIITTWRYPGVSPVGEPVPIPDDIMAEISRDEDGK